MRKLTPTICLTLAVILGSVGVRGNVFAQTVDFAVNITNSVLLADKSIYITTSSLLADKSVCITNLRSLDAETLRTLGGY